MKERAQKETETLAAVAAVAEIQRQSVEKGMSSVTPAEIDSEIASVRQARTKP